MTMDARTKAALAASIAHWEANVAAETPRETVTGRRHCALCSEFWLDVCKGCPVREFTGKGGCRGTPYGDAENARREWMDRQDEIKCKIEWKRAAAAEVEFLKSLQKGEPDDTELR